MKKDFSQNWSTRIGNQTLTSEVKVRYLIHQTMRDTYAVMPKNNNISKISKCLYETYTGLLE